MRLSLEHLRFNVAEYMKLVRVIKAVLSYLEEPSGDFDETMAIAVENLRQLDKLLANGVTEVEIPEKPS